MMDHRRLAATALAATVGVLALLLLTAPTTEAGDTSLLVHVYDDTLVLGTGDAPVSGARVALYHADNGTLAASAITNAEGTAEFSDLVPGMYNVQIEATGYENWTSRIEVNRDIFGDPMEVTGRLTPTSYGPRPPEPGPLRWFILAAVVALTSLVMYSKIRHDNLLNNAIRRRIIDHIKDNPGVHYRAILTELDLPMGVLSYHLNRLEKAELVKSRQDGMFRRFYVAGRKTEVRFFLSDVQEAILAVIRENQGISQSRIAERISVSRKVVNYHVNILDQAGLIYVESRGRESACFVVERPARTA